jgi:hypothetical protein
MVRPFLMGLSSGAILVALCACKGGGIAGSGGDNGGPRSGDDGCGTCAEVYVNGGIACGPGPSSDAFDALSLCACAGACDNACGASLCTTQPADEACGACLTMNCAAEEMTCAQN